MEDSQDIDLLLKDSESDNESEPSQGKKSNSLQVFSFEVLDKEIKNDPKNPYLFYTRGKKFFEEKNEHEKALKDLNTALTFDPHFEEVFVTKGALFWAQNKPQLALSEMNKAIKSSEGENEHYFFMRGNVYKKINELEKAIKDMEKVLEINPTFDEGINFTLGSLYKQLGKFKLSKMYFTNQVRRKKPDPKSFFQRGTVNEKLGDHKSALADYEKSLGLIQNKKRSQKVVTAINRCKRKMKDTKILPKKALPKKALPTLPQHGRSKTTPGFSKPKSKLPVPKGPAPTPKRKPTQNVSPEKKGYRPRNVNNRRRRVQPTAQHGKKNGKGKMKEDVNTDCTVWHCSFDNNESGMMVCVGDSLGIVIGDKIKEKLGNKSFHMKDVYMNQLFQSQSLQEIVFFLGEKRGKDFANVVKKFQNTDLKLLEKENKEMTLKAGLTQSELNDHSTNTLLTKVPKEIDYLEGLPPEKLKSETKRVEKYKKILERARDPMYAKDFDTFDKMKVLRINIGRDRKGRMVCLFKEQPFKKEQLESLLLYIISRLDPCTNEEYVLVWCIYNLPNDEKKPGMKFLLSSYRSLCRKVRKNLKGLFLIHPTIMYQVIIRFFRPVISKKFFKKLHLCTCIQDVSKYGIDLNQCRLPASVVTWDIDKRNEALVFPIFGESLRKVMMRRDNINENIPLFLIECLDFLKPHIKVEGIFRKAGNQLQISELKKCFDHNYQLDLLHNDMHSVAGVIKLWIRELPNPLLRFEYYDEFMDLVRNEKRDDGNIKLESMITVIDKLPKINWLVAREIFQFLNTVSKQASSNKMNVKNLAIVFAPNFLKLNNDADPKRMLLDANKAMAVTAFLIERCYDIFLEE